MNTTTLSKPKQKPPYSHAQDTEVVIDSRYGKRKPKIWIGECSLDNIEYNCKPTGYDAARITETIGDKRIRLTEDELIDAIAFDGKSWSPSIFSGSKRCTETFVGLNALVLDFDNGFDTLDEILDRAKANNLKFSFIHQSFSHTEARPKYRGVFLLKELLEDIDEAKIYLEYLKEVFAGFVDNSAAEPTRFFYGGKSLVLHNPRHYYNERQLKNKIGTDKYFEILNRLAKKGQYKPRHSVAESATCYASTDYEDLDAAREFLESKTLSPREKQRLIQELLIAKNAISQFPPGRKMHRYNLLFNYSMALGKLTQIPRSLAYDTLVKAALSNDYFARHWKHDIEQVVKSGLEFGARISVE